MMPLNLIKEPKDHKEAKRWPMGCINIYTTMYRCWSVQLCKVNDTIERD